MNIEKGGVRNGAAFFYGDGGQTPVALQFYRCQNDFLNGDCRLDRGEIAGLSRCKSNR
jgi:hypothetical protein